MKKNNRKNPKEKYGTKYLRINTIKILLNKICLLYFILIKGFKSNSIVQIVINKIGEKKIYLMNFQYLTKYLLMKKNKICGIL